MTQTLTHEIDLNIKEITVSKSRYAPENGGWGAFILGLLVLPWGIFLAYAVLIKGRAADFPLFARIMLWVMAILLTLGGTGLMTGSLKYLWLKQKRKKSEQLYPFEYWRSDYDWKAEGSYGESVIESRKSWFSLLRGVVIFGALTYLTHFHGVLLFFDALLLVSFFYLLYKTFQKNKYGTPYLRYHRFPYAPGEKINLTLSLSKTHSDFFKNLKATLRYVYETPKVTRVSSSVSKTRTSTSHVVVQCYAETIRFAEGAGAFTIGPQEIPLTFDPPTEKNWSTELDTVHPRYWFLELKNDAPGIDYSETFLIPVYASQKINHVEKETDPEE